MTCLRVVVTLARDAGSVFYLARGVSIQLWATD